MLLWFLLIFAVLQGLLEWLPVSSEGQAVVILTSLLQINSQEAMTIALWLHLGTLAAVCVKYWKDLVIYVDFKKQDEEIKQWRWFILLTTIGTAIFGVPCYLFLYFLGENATFGEYVSLLIGVALLITAAILFYSQKGEKKGKKISELTKKEMLLAGLLQGFTIIPGISRSGMTMAGLLFMGVNKEESLKGSFIMSIPAVAGGFVLNLSWLLIKHGEVLPVQFWKMLIAIVLTFVIGYATIEVLLQLAKRYNFAIVCLVLGLIIILFFILGLILS